MDGEALKKRFQRAAERVAGNHNLKLTDAQKLRLYGLYKQAEKGDCTTQRPGWFDFTAKAKWDSWHALVGMSVGDAMLKYTSVVGEVDPDWETDTLNSTAKQGGLGKEKQGDSNTVGHSVSTLAGKDAEECISDDKKTLFDWCKEGEVNKLLALVTATNINMTDNQGLGLLHWGCDRGNLDIVRGLVEKGADVNIQDTDKQTPLHYAASCDHGNIVRYLLQSVGADRTIRDSDSNLPEDVVSNSLTKKLFQT